MVRKSLYSRATWIKRGEFTKEARVQQWGIRLPHPRSNTVGQEPKVPLGLKRVGPLPGVATIRDVPGELIEGIGQISASERIYRSRTDGQSRPVRDRSEEHTSELQSLRHLV